MSKHIDTSDLIEEPGQGHNSFSKHDLEKVIDELEAANEEMDVIRQHIKAVMETAAEKGLDKRTIREAMKIRALDPETRAERESLRDLYLGALGLV